MGGKKRGLNGKSGLKGYRKTIIRYCCCIMFVNKNVELDENDTIPVGICSYHGESKSQ